MMAPTAERLSAACGWPTAASIADDVREARRAVNAARHTAEDAVDDAVLKIRRHPIRTVGVAACVAFVAGAALATAIISFARSRS